jgi:hypothetical protein
MTTTKRNTKRNMKKKSKKRTRFITTKKTDADMKALLDKWGGGSEDDDEGDDDDQTGAQQHRNDDIPTSALEDCILDHIVLAAPDLDQAMNHFEKMTGVLPEECPSYKRLGTRHF